MKIKKLDPVIFELAGDDGFFFFKKKKFNIYHVDYCKLGKYYIDQVVAVEEDGTKWPQTEMKAWYKYVEFRLPADFKIIKANINTFPGMTGDETKDEINVLNLIIKKGDKNEE